MAQAQEGLVEGDSKLARLETLLKAALARIVDLEEKFKKNSKNSSKPPSTDYKSNTSGKGDKRRGSRKGVSRKVLPPEQVDHFQACHLDTCPHCHSSNLVDLGIGTSLQQTELPEVKATVTQFDLHKGCCQSCGKEATALLPTGIPYSAFGPNLMALIATLTGVFHLSKRDAMTLLKDLYGIDISEGSIINVEERVTASLDEVYARIHRFVTQGPLCKHFDETGWRNQGKRHYVWVASTSEAVCYAIDPSRSTEAFLKFVGRLSEAAVVTDRYAVYHHITNPHQYCLAHLIREFRGFSQRDGPDAGLGKALKEELQTACRAHAALIVEVRFVCA